MAAQVPSDRALTAGASPAQGEASVDELVRASGLLARESTATSLIEVLVDQSVDISGSDLAAAYLYLDPDSSTSPLRLVHRRGRYDLPQRLSRDLEAIDFVVSSGEALVLHDRDRRFFTDALLDPAMRSAVVLPLETPRARIGVLILNIRRPDYYRRTHLSFLESFAELASGMLHNCELFEELRDQLRRVEALERYQESVFSSMTNLLVTTDEDGRIRYFNEVAAQRIGLQETDLGRPFSDAFSGKLDKRIVNTVTSAASDGREVLGVEGILKTGKSGIDFSLNVSPLQGKRGRREGLTLLFTDQSAERELKSQVKVVKEERRVIKDMFARYLSNELVESIMLQPELVRPGGDKKQATIFFADIRGYTSFSESKEPEYIIEVLNAYFTEAVEIIINHRGYIDKFIGDAIMAVWGVPLVTVEQDAINAVSCAVEIQARVQARDRVFFRGEANALKVGIGMHTGPLVAGNLGSARRMDYSVIGDTVNVAARLEGVAKGGDVIITESTRDLIGDRFKLQELEPVKVKGKERPIHIFRVIKRVQ